MALKNYSGGCHCGAVRYEAEIDFGEGTTRCNCSICSKVRAWFVFVPKGRLRLTAKPGALADYQWVPAGQPHAHLHFRFCKTCGIRVFAEGDLPSLGGRSMRSRWRRSRTPIRTSWQGRSNMSTARMTATIVRRRTRG
jgi:hypothetical protein